MMQISHNKTGSDNIYTLNFQIVLLYYVSMYLSVYVSIFLESQSESGFIAKQVYTYKEFAVVYYVQV